MNVNDDTTQRRCGDNAIPLTSNEAPFEWLTSPMSLRRCIAECLSNNETNESADSPTPCSRKALHVGCGTSTLGEMMLLEESFHIESVVNTDSDRQALEKARTRWAETCANQQQLKESSMEFRCVDYASIDSATNVSKEEEFDLVVDKSTLDCLLCTDTAAAHLLCNVYNSLRPNGGVYLLISFHLVDFLRPLIADLPDADWDVTFHVLERQVETLPTTRRTKKKTKPTTGLDALPSIVHESDQLDSTPTSTSRTTWSPNGSFAPNSAYRRTVNVLQCRKRNSRRVLDPTRVYEHVHAVNNEWYASTHPLATEQRQATLAQSFRDGKAALDLEECYRVLFTDAEREHYDKDDFLSDWDSFLETRVDLPKRSLTLDTAVEFLKEMQ